jgi:hypothetical protein
MIRKKILSSGILSSGQKSSLLNGLISYWKLDEYSNGSFPSTRMDSFGTNHLSDHINTNSISGKINNGALFNGSVWLEHDSNSSLSIGGTSFTIDFWLKADLFNNICIAKLTNTGIGEFQIGVMDPGKVYFELWKNVGVIGTVTSNTIANLSVSLQYIQVYYDKDLGKVGIIVNNGTPVESNTSDIPSSTSVSFTIGSRSDGGSKYRGVVDEVGFYKRRLTIDETTSRYNSGNGLSYPFLVSPPPSILIQSPSKYQVFQRDGSNFGTINIYGTVVNGLNNYDVEASWNNSAYSQIASNISTSFSGSLSTIPAGQGTLTVRIKNTGTNTIVSTKSVGYVGIGDVFIVAGQSNAEGQGTTYNTYSNNLGIKAGMFPNDYRWSELGDPVNHCDNCVDVVLFTQLGKGSPWPLLATNIMNSTGFPVAFIGCALGGSSIQDWQPDTNHLLRTTLYGSMNYKSSEMGARAVLFHQGEQDVSLGTSQAVYNAKLDILANAINSDIGVPILVAKLHNHNNPTVVNAAISEAISDNVNVKLGADNTGITTAPDGLHFTTDLEIQGLANRWWTALQNAFGW